MYAIIRTGGKQAKVTLGDVLDVELLRGDEELTFTPLLVVNDKGEAVTGREQLSKVKVKAKVLGEVQGDKVDIFKYRAKTGYRRRMGHRQRYTRIEITDIQMPKARARKSAAAEEAPKEEPKVEVEEG